MVAVAREGVASARGRRGGSRVRKLFAHCSGGGVGKCERVVRRREAGGLLLGVVGGAVGLGGGVSPVLAFDNPLLLGDGFKKFYGEATTAASYGGYGGGDKSEDRFKYTYLIPEEWRKDVINKTEKGVNGTDSRFYNPTNKNQKAYVVTFPGYLQLKEDRDAIMSDLSISDLDLQDLLLQTDLFESSSTDKSGQLFYNYHISGLGKELLATATVDGGRIYVMFVFSPTRTYDTDKEMLQRMVGSFTTLSNGVSQEDAEYFKRAT